MELRRGRGLAVAESGFVCFLGEQLVGRICGMAKRTNPPNNPPADPPSIPPCKPAAPKSQTAGLHRGLSENVERGPDGKLKRRPTPPNEEKRTDNEPGIPSALADMRWVNEQDASADDTPAKVRMRKFADSQPAKFVDKMITLTESWLQSKRAAGPGNPDVDRDDDESPFEEFDEAWATVLEWEKHKDEFMKWKSQRDAGNVGSPA